MMNRSFSFFVAISSLLFTTTLFSLDSSSVSGNVYSEMTETQKLNYYKQLDQALKDQGKVIEGIISRAADKRTYYPSVEMELEHANSMLEIKRTLVANFVETPSLRSPLVRAELIEVLNQETVTVMDLAELQTLVNQEKPKVLKSDMIIP